MAETITIAGEGVFPESIASDAAGTIYVGSNTGTVYRALPGSDTADPWLIPDDTNGLMSVFGVLADDAKDLLWVCTNPPMGAGPEAGGPAIKTFSLETGAMAASYPLNTGSGPAMCNDMTIAANGDVFASEMLGGRIMKLAAGGDTFEIWAQDEEFGTIDGISFAADGTLYANAIQRNTLLRINRDDAGAFAGVEVLETSQAMVTPDGLRPLEDGRMLQSEGNSGLITLVSFNADGSATIETIAEGIDYASSVTPVNGRAYYPEGKLSFMFDPEKAGQDPGTFVIRSVAIPGAE